MGVFYLVCFGFLGFILFRLVAANVKTSFLNLLLICTSSLVSLIAVEAIILETLTIPSKLFFLSIIHIVLTLSIINWKRGELWKPHQISIDKIDIFAIIISFCIGVGFSLYFYSSVWNIRFETSDPAVHYFFTRHFAETSHLMLSGKDIFPYQHMTTYPFLSYLNTGLIMQALSFIDPINIYIASNIIIYIFTLLVIYALVKSYAKLDVFLFIATFFFASAGYNINALIFGFTSQMAGLLIILCLMLCIKNLRGKVNNKIYACVICLHLLGVLFAYYYFIPVVLLSIFTHELVSRRSIRIKDVFSWEHILYGIVVGLFTYIYLFHFAPEIHSSFLDNIKEEGYITRDLYSSFVPLMLFSIFAIVKWIKNKFYDPILVTMIFLLLFAAVILFVGIQGHASSYYFYKNHFVIGALLIVFYIIGLSYIKEKSKSFYYSYILFILILAAPQLGLNDYINKKNSLFNPTIPNYLGQVFYVNKVKIKDTQVILSRDELNVIKFLDRNKKEYVGGYGYLPVLGGVLQQLWVESSTGIWPKYDNHTLYGLFDEVNMMDIKKWESDPQKNPYIVVIGEKGRQFFDDNSDSDKYEVVLQSKDSRTSVYKFHG